MTISRLSSHLIKCSTSLERSLQIVKDLQKNDTISKSECIHIHSLFYKLDIQSSMLFFEIDKLNKRVKKDSC